MRPCAYTRMSLSRNSASNAFMELTPPRTYLRTCGSRQQSRPPIRHEPPPPHSCSARSRASSTTISTGVFGVRSAGAVHPARFLDRGVRVMALALVQHLNYTHSPCTINLECSSEVGMGCVMPGHSEQRADGGANPQEKPWGYRKLSETGPDPRGVADAEPPTPLTREARYVADDTVPPSPRA